MTDLPTPFISATELAEFFHETYERLAPKFGYLTRTESAVPWREVPEANKQLMMAVCVAVKDRLGLYAPFPGPRGASDGPTVDPAVLTSLRQIHWQTQYADGPMKGKPCCGNCAWLDGVPKSWPCATLRLFGVAS